MTVNICNFVLPQTLDENNNPTLYNCAKGENREMSQTKSNI